MIIIIINIIIIIITWYNKNLISISGLVTTNQFLIIVTRDYQW